MQKTKPEDTPKIIALAAAILAVFAYVIYSFTKGSAAPAAESERTAAAAPSSNQLMGQPFASSDPSAMTPGSTSDSAFSAETMLADSAPLPTSARDPFRSPVAGPATESGATYGSQYEPTAIAQPSGNLTSQVSSPDAGSVPMPVAAPPPVEVELKGVVSGGSRPMALVRIGGTMLNVYEGQKITKDLVVKKIGVSSIEFRNQSEVVSVEVGTMLMASFVLPESVVQANPSAHAPASVGAVSEMPATSVYAAPEQGSAVRAATKAYGPS
jgi:hypothetical protein